MTPDKPVRQAELPAERADLVLEQHPERLDEPESHALRQAADIVVRLDRDRRTAVEGNRLDDVRIERSLGEKVRAAKLCRLRLEHLDEGGADDLALALGVIDAGQPLEEQRARIGMHQRDVEMAAEQADHLPGLARAHQARIHEDAAEPVPDRFMQQQRGNRAVHAAGKPAHDPPAADLRPDLGDSRFPEGRHRPVGLGPRDAAHEVADQPGAVGRMHDLGVELHAVEPPVLVRDGGIGRGFAARGDPEPLRQRLDPVAVAHPDRVAPARLPDALEQRALRDRLHRCAPELPVVGGPDMGAHLRRHDLLPVADAQHRRARLEQRRMGRRRRG